MVKLLDRKVSAVYKSKTWFQQPFGAQIGACSSNSKVAYTLIMSSLNGCSLLELLNIDAASAIRVEGCEDPAQLMERRLKDMIGFFLLSFNVE